MQSAVSVFGPSAFRLKVNARDVHNVRGRKSDVKDCE